MLAVRDISPTLRRNLKLRLFRGSVACSWALHRAEGNLIRCLVAVSANRERHFQHNMLLVPLGLHLEVNARHARIKNDVAHKCRILKMIFDLDYCTKRTALSQLDLVCLIEVPVLLLEVSVNIPCVPL